MGKLIGSAAAVFIGAALGLAVVEIGLALAGFPRGVPQPARTLPYIDTASGLGKCYPSDPAGYFPYDLRREEDWRKLAPTVTAVSGLPGGRPLAEQLAHLRAAVPHCTNIELVPLNKGPAPQRQREVAVIGDSFAFGEGLRLEDTIGFRLAEVFAHYNFPNLAWPGVAVDTLFEVETMDPLPEVVLYFYNINDVLRSESFDERIRAAERRLAERSGIGWRRCEWSRTCRLLANRWRQAEKSRATIEYYRELYFAAGNEVHRQRSFAAIAALEKKLEGGGSRLVVAMFPLFYKPLFGDYPFTEIHRLVAAEVKRLGIEMIDLLPAYRRYLSWNGLIAHPLDRHPSAEAIDVAARYLGETLRLPGSKRPHSGK